jgi:CTP synthase
VVSGTLPGRGLVEYVELPRDVHPYYVSTQAHPEFRSRPNRAHPLFAGLIKAAVDEQRAARLVEVERPVDRRPDALAAGSDSERSFDADAADRESEVEASVARA